MKQYDVLLKRESHYYCRIVASDSEEALDIARELEAGAHPDTKHEQLTPIHIRQIPTDIPPSNEGKLHEFRQL